MLKRYYQWKGMRILEIHYSKNIADNSNFKNVDIIKTYQVGKNIKNKLHEFYTLQIDLTKTEDEIFKNFRSNTRNEIRKNIKNDEITCSYNDCLSDSDIHDFAHNLEKFMAGKNYYVDCNFLISQIKNFRKNTLLTRATKEGTILTEHLYFFDDERARYKSGISYRLEESIGIGYKTIGRSNRRLHWFDIQEFKNRGIKIYDLGGISRNTNDKGLLNINRFKEGFSKNEIMEYEGNIPVSFKGKLALFIKKTMDRLLKR